MILVINPRIAAVAKAMAKRYTLIQEPILKLYVKCCEDLGIAGDMTVEELSKGIEEKIYHALLEANEGLEDLAKANFVADDFKKQPILEEEWQLAAQDYQLHLRDNLLATGGDPTAIAQLMDHFEMNLAVLTRMSMKDLFGNRAA